MEKYIRNLVRYRILILASIIAVTIFLGYYARQMRTDNSVEIWLSKNDSGLDYYRAFLKKFGDEEFLVVAFSAVNIFTKESIREINAIAEKLKKLDGIAGVTSLADVFKNKVTSPAFKEKISTGQGRPLMNIFRQQILADPMYQNSIISKDGRTTAIIATVKGMGPESRRHLVADAKRMLAEIDPPAGGIKDGRRKYHLAGPSVINAELDRMSKQDMERFTPFMFIMAVIVLGCLFRSLHGVLIPMLTVGVCIVWITGCFVLFSQTMNMVSNMLLPLTFIIALSASIHLMGHYCSEGRFFTDKEDAICNTIRDVGIPIFMTTVTTVIGFISLAASSIPPVLITGLFMSGCAALVFIISMTFIPILLSFIPCLKPGIMNAADKKEGDTPAVRDICTKRLDRDEGFSAVLSRLGRFTVRYKTLILLGAVAMGAIFMWGISKVRVESDIVASFPENSRIARDNNYIERHLMGLLPVEIIAETRNGISVFQPYVLNNLTSLQKYLRSIPEVTGSISVADYIRKVHQTLNGDNPHLSPLPNSEKETAGYVKLASVYGDKYINNLYTKDYGEARLSVRMKQVGSDRYQAVIKSIKEYIHKHLDTTALSWHITGIVPLLISVQDNILRSEIQSFSLAFLLTFVSTAVVLKSVRIGFISVIPNLLPITVTLGLMGFAGMKLDAATVMIASIALGISVDNTIHIFYRFKKEISVDGDYSKAVCRTLQGVGKTAMFTSLSAAFGFMVFSFSSFKPIQYFGVLTSVTMLNAIVSDLLISPSCLMLFRPVFRY